MINSANGESTNGGSKKVKAICGGFSINEKWLDSISINEIINFLLMQ